jgi:hypothetical protein
MYFFTCLVRHFIITRIVILISVHPSADSPLLVVGYSLGQYNNTATFQGDPLMTLLPSPDFAPASYLLDLSHVTGNDGNRTWRCFVTAAARQEFAVGVRVDGSILRMFPVQDNLTVSSCMCV